jgi:hypothetical protein
VPDASIKILLEYKSSGDHTAQALFSQLISNSQGWVKVVEEKEEATLVRRKMKSPG